MSAQKCFWLGLVMAGVLLIWASHGLYIMVWGTPKESVLVGPLEFTIGIIAFLIAFYMARLGYRELPKDYSVGRRITVGLMLLSGVGLFIGTQYVPVGGFVLFGAGVAVVTIALYAMTTINEQPLQPPVSQKRRAF